MTELKRGGEFAYMESRSGEYDETEQRFMADPYADGFAAHGDGLTLEQTIHAVMRSKAKNKAEVIKLRKAGWYEAQSVAI